ncbi:MAG: GGDEF domain-containing protein [Steroidobacteraceae bacterium]
MAGKGQVVQAKGEPDPWKRKYFDALRSLEQEERGFRSLESVLRRIVNRLCFAALGQTPLLDAELRRLTDAMRKKADESELERLFAPLTDAISALDDPETRGPKAAANIAPTLTTPLTGAVAAAIPAAAAPVQHIAAPPVAAPAESTPERPLATVTSLQVPPRQPDPPEADAVLVADQRVRLLLSRILAELRRDSRLAQRVGTIDAQLGLPLRQLGLPVLLSAIADLTIERIAGVEQEKIEVEKLLAQISARLDEMSAYVADEDADRKLALENTAELNTRLTLEMHELGQSVDSTLDVVQLKLNVRSRLDSIGSHLHDFRSREEDRVRLQWERSEKMRQRLERLEEESREMQQRLRDEQRLSLVDALTQIPNRLAYDQRLAEEFARWNRFHQPLCVAAWDIDHFKRINDAYGHRAGDKVLRIVAETLTERLRETDFLARYGGEEFVMILPVTELEGALRVIEEMRAGVATLGFHFRGNPVGVTVSCGVSAFHEGDSPDEVFERADRALYRAKQAGRNRIEHG